MAAFHRSAAPRPASRREKGGPVFCVGWKAFVHWPLREEQAAGPLPLTDLNGKAMENDLADGQQVEILSWRPHSRDGVLYQIRRLTDRSEWWIGARHLRPSAVATAAVEAPPQQ